MNTVFVDTIAWIALLNRSDALHTPARDVLRSLHEQDARLVTTEFVLLEVADVLALPATRTPLINLFNTLRQRSSMTLVTASSALFAKGWALYCQHSHMAWRLTHCTSFVVMSALGINDAFTCDPHFSEAGFTCLLAAPADKARR
ncbi:MAG: type II toxin-antitoxin system VapC family toxin [Chloroflexaceae bacterium]|nr:type II toxin-antitoxin system VapC family toxin [Chloroflexaceae bacterium]